MSAKEPSLPRFERCVAARDHGASVEEALRILDYIERNLGAVDGIEKSPVPNRLDAAEQLGLFATRFVSAFGQLICDPAFELSLRTFETLVSYNRWLGQLFRISSFGNSAHLLPLIAETTAKGELKFRDGGLQKFFVLYSPSTGLNFDFAQCMQNGAAASTVAFLNYIGTRYCYSEEAFALREGLLDWLPGKFDHVKLGTVALSKSAAPYMYCSYAMTPRKHNIKADIIRQLRRFCLDFGCAEMAMPPRRIPGRKPTIVVVTDNFYEGHSVFRTHSRCIKGLREAFHVVGVAYAHSVQPAVEACFDEIILIPREDYATDVKTVCNAILAREPQIVFHLGVGMSAHTIAVAALRLAPVQCVSFGHTATTMSPAIDYMILPEDFVKSRTCYSEQLVLVKPEAMPYAPCSGVDDVIGRVGRTRSAGMRDPIIRIAVPASTMKLNPRLFDALSRIANAAKARTEFHFFSLTAIGIAHLALRRHVREVLPNSVVHERMEHLPYLEQLGECDLFLCPFPYGNMNSIIDAAQFGMPGVCLDGEEAHAHADAAYFRRIGLPDELITDSVEQYVAAAVRLIDDTEWRNQCRALVQSGDFDKRLYAGDERLFCEAMLGLISSDPSGDRGP